MFTIIIYRGQTETLVNVQDVMLLILPVVLVILQLYPGSTIVVQFCSIRQLLSVYRYPGYRYPVHRYPRGTMVL